MEATATKAAATASEGGIGKQTRGNKNNYG
jgi:hypothetical protein